MQKIARLAIHEETESEADSISAAAKNTSHYRVFLYCTNIGIRQVLPDFRHECDALSPHLPQQAAFLEPATRRDDVDGCDIAALCSRRPSAYGTEIEVSRRLLIVYLQQPMGRKLPPALLRSCGIQAGATKGIED